MNIMKQKNHEKISFLDKIQKSDDKYGWLVLGIYILLLAVVSYFHEPWFDEAQSWLIARDASISDIIFYIPHYEGHPPLWHIYLVPFAKFGMPYELRLKLAAIIINAAAMGLLIFKSPFHKAIRYTIPFTYYFFFLYGVVSRCYSITMLGFVLMAIAYRERHTKPYRYMLAMLLVCLSTAYGIMICAGVALIWLIEIIKETKLRGIFRDRRMHSLAMLLVFVLFTIYLITPKENTYAMNLDEFENPFYIRLFYMIVLAPLESLLFTAIPGNYAVMDAAIPGGTIITGSALFAVFALCMFILGRTHKKLLVLILPYSLFAVFASMFYFTEHHISVVAYFLLFWFWIVFDDGIIFEMPKKLRQKITDSDQKKIKKYLWMFPAVIIGFSLFWNVSASIEDINTNYCSGREIAGFIKTYNLEEKIIMTEWLNISDDDISAVNIAHQSSPVVLAYFSDNIFYTFNGGDDRLCYNTHIIPTESDTLAAYEKYRQLGAPDIIIGHPDLSAIFDNDVSYADYTLVKVVGEKRISKNDFVRSQSYVRIFMRNDLVPLYNVQEISPDEWSAIISGQIDPR